MGVAYGCRDEPVASSIGVMKMQIATFDPHRRVNPTIQQSFPNLGSDKINVFNAHPLPDPTAYLPGWTLLFQRPMRRPLVSLVPRVLQRRYVKGLNELRLSCRAEHLVAKPDFVSVASNVVVVTVDVVFSKSLPECFS